MKNITLTISQDINVASIYNLARQRPERDTKGALATMMTVSGGMASSFFSALMPEQKITPIMAYNKEKVERALDTLIEMQGVSIVKVNGTKRYIRQGSEMHLTNYSLGSSEIVVKFQEIKKV